MNTSGTRLTKEQKEQIVELYKQGVKIEDIMEQVGCSRPTAYTWINKAGLNREIAEDKVQTAIDLYTNNPEMKIAEIVEKTGISKATIYRKLKKHMQDQQGS